MEEEIKTILVSAHPDDVALSVGGSILAGYFERPILIVTVFSYGGTAPFYNGTHDAETLFRVMVDEDEAYAAAVDSSFVDFGMTDAWLNSVHATDFDRLRWFSSIVRGPPPPNDTSFELQLTKLAMRVPRSFRWMYMDRVARFEPTLTTLRRKLAQVFSRFPEARVASPLSLGLHPDHVLVSRACKDLIDPKRITFYEDLPYSMTYRLGGIHRHIGLFDRDLRPVWVNIDGVLKQKLENLKLYGSQLAQVDVGRVSLHATRLRADGRAYERLWVHDRPIKGTR